MSLALEINAHKEELRRPSHVGERLHLTLSAQLLLRELLAKERLGILLLPVLVLQPTGDPDMVTGMPASQAFASECRTGLRPCCDGEQSSLHIARVGQNFVFGT